MFLHGKFMEQFVSCIKMRQLSAMWGTWAGPLLDCSQLRPSGDRGVASDARNTQLDKEEADGPPGEIKKWTNIKFTSGLSGTPFLACRFRRCFFLLLSLLNSAFLDFFQIPNSCLSGPRCVSPTLSGKQC